MAQYRSMSEQATRPWTKPIIVGVDGSESSADALRQGKRLAEALQLPVEVVTAWTWPAFVEGAGYFGEWSPEEDARTIAEEAVKQVFGSEASGVTIRIAQGPPAKLLIEASEGASVLVVGSRGHGGFAGLLLGSVSSACAEHARCPVLVVHDEKQSA